MNNTLLAEQIQQKWAPVLEHTDLPKIGDSYRKNVTAVLLENQERFLKEAASVSPTNSGMVFPGADASGGIASFDPVLISLVRRAMPNLIAYDICGVQPMNGPTGLIFAMKSKYTNKAGAEALFDEASTNYAGLTSGVTTEGFGTFTADGDEASGVGTDDFGVSDLSPLAGSTIMGLPGDGFSTEEAEELGGQAGDHFNEMAFNIDRTSVTAKTRALKAEYTTELAQDLKAVHGLDAETELANILSTEILAEINREVVRTIYAGAKLGAQQLDLHFKGGGTSGGRGQLGVTHATAAAANHGGIYDLDQDSDGRWSAERFRGLMFQIEREANVIAKETRRGKGNFVICSSDVASALAMSGHLSLSGGTNQIGDVDDTGNTFVGTLNGRMKVYVDPYVQTGGDFCCVGYRGTSPYDAGLFYCPYVPLQMVRAVGENTFQPKIGFKTRYGLVNNPFVATADPSTSAARRINQYYRIFRVDNIHGADS